MKNLVLIGNGFDLSHNLKTKYSDFIDSVDPARFTQTTTYKLTKPNSPNLKTEDIDFIKTNDLYTKIIETRKELWCDIEAVYYKNLLRTDDPKLLNRQFEEIKKELQEYLKLESQSINPLESYEKLFQYFRDKPAVITFNYTKTAELYSGSLRSLTYLHGELESSKNQMIFGYAANEDDTQTLLSKNNDEYLKNIKQYEYLGANNFWNTLRLIKNHTKINVILIGLSCGLSDSLILKEILGHENVRYIFNLYYENRSSHLSTLMNVNRIIGENAGFQKFMPMPNCLRMPQHDKPLTENEILTFFAKNKSYGL